MNKRIFKSIFFTSITVFVACLALVMIVLYNYFSAQHKSELKNEAVFIATAIENTGGDFLNSVDSSTTTRITWIQDDGTVIYDSAADAATLENHKDREEVKQAIDSGSGESYRYSSTLSEKTINYALKLKDDTVLRISSTQYSVISLFLEMFQSIAIIVVIAVVLSAVFASKISKSITNPINAIDLENPDDSKVYDEIKPLVHRISSQNKQIVEQLKSEHEVQDRMRREFTANVSHELKTPLTSISGFAEIIRDGLVKQEDISRFAGNIYEEAQRLIVLVGDIIKLSQLDENAVPAKKEKMDLYAICKDVISHLEHSANKKNISIELTGEHAEIYAVEQIIEEIVYNLCDNAIKYNKYNGSVKVSIRQLSEGVELLVEDTGIGIPEDSRDRIFERFYRVNKSHSKEIGGTGLGLSIVKHGASYHNAEITVDSELEKGTVIKLLFKEVGEEE